MPEVLTIALAGPVAAVGVINAPDGICAAVEQAAAGRGLSIGEPAEATGQLERADLTRELEEQRTHLNRLCQMAGNLVSGLQKLQEETVAGHRQQIARLAVEIARKILMHEIARGDYDIQAVVEEALKRAPTRQDIVIRVNPEDLPLCQQLQRDHPDGPFAGLVFTADWTIGRSECLVETPKGIVKSFIEEHLEHISEALQSIDEG